MGSLSIGHWVIVLLVVLLLFGAGKIPRLMGDMAKGVKAFKRGMKDDDGDAATTEAEPPRKALDHAAPGQAGGAVNRDNAASH